MTGRVTVLLVDRHTTTVYTGRDYVSHWDDRGALAIGAEAWERAEHPAPVDLDDDGPCTGCGRPIDRTRPYVTRARHLEVTTPDGTDVLEAAPMGQYHVACEPGEGR